MTFRSLWLRSPKRRIYALTLTTLYFTTKPLGRGTGLGLPSVLGILKQHNGVVRAENGREGGACFSLYFPAGDSTAATEKEEPKVEAAARGNGEAVWVIEDDPPVGNMAAMLLTQAGYNTRTFIDRADTLGELNTASPELLLADMVMPGMTLSEFLAGVNQIHPKVPVLLMTGHAEDALSHETIDRVEHPVLRKPFSSLQFRAAVRESLQAEPST